MGAGASLEGGLGLEPEMQRYLCHACRRVVTSPSLSSQDFVCPNCNSSFIEELGGVLRHSDLMPQRHANNRFINMFGSDELSSEQSRRITNASAMLRLLESQLREELEQLQLAFESTNLRDLRNGINRNAAATNKKKLTKIMAGKIRMFKLDLDALCSQPSCPICSEDFVVTGQVTKLPCTHIFHHACVVPWLEMKQNCPICRAEITDDIPTLTELEKFSKEELTCWLGLMKDPTTVNYSNCYECALETTSKNTARRSEGKEEEAPLAEEMVSKKETNESRSEIALKLQEELVLYQKDTLDAEAETEALHAQQARALSYGLGGAGGVGGGMGGILGRAVHVQGPIDRPLQEYFHYDRPERNERQAGTSPSLTHSASSPGVRAPHSIDEYIASPNRIGGSNDRRLARLQSEPEGSIAAALRRGFPASSSTIDPRGHSITGSTLLPNGLHLHHNIRIVDDSEEEEEGVDSTEDSSTTEETQRMYQAANQAHLAQYGVGGLANSSSPPRNVDLITSSPNRNVGRMDASSEAIMREFNRSLHTELGLTDEQMPLAERTLLNSHAEGLHSAQLLNNLINGPFAQSSGVEAHQSPTWREEMDGILTSAGLSSASAPTSTQQMRGAQLAAISSYMGNDTAARFNALSNYNTSTAAGSYAPTTYQIRATGDGSFMTVPVTHTPSLASQNNNITNSDLER